MTGRPPFKMPIDIDFGTMLGTERFTVWDSLATQVFFLDVDAPVVSLVFDPDDWILADGSVLPGEHRVFWDGRIEGGRPAAAGTYFVRVRTGDETDRGRILLIP